MGLDRVSSLVLRSAPDHLGALMSLSLRVASQLSAPLVLSRCSSLLAAPLSQEPSRKQGFLLAWEGSSLAMAAQLRLMRVSGLGYLSWSAKPPDRCRVVTRVCSSSNSDGEGCRVDPWIRKDEHSELDGKTRLMPSSSTH